MLNRGLITAFFLLIPFMLTSCSDGSSATEPQDDEEFPLVLGVELIAGDEQASAPGALLPDSVVLKVTDQHGDPHSGIDLVVELPGGGTTEPASPTTGANGEARFLWRLGPAEGKQTLRVRPAGEDPSPVEIVAEARPGDTKVASPDKDTELTTPSGSRVRIPAGATTAEVEVVAMDETVEVNGAEYRAITLYPSGQAFESPVELRFDATEMDPAAGVAGYDPDQGLMRWIPSAVDEETGELVGMTSHFSTYITTCVARTSACLLGKISPNSDVTYGFRISFDEAQRQDVRRGLAGWEAALSDVGITFSEVESADGADVVFVGAEEYSGLFTGDMKKYLGLAAYDALRSQRLIVVNDRDERWADSESQRQILEGTIPHDGSLSLGDLVQHEMGHHLGFNNHHSWWTCDLWNSNADECKSPPVMATQSILPNFPLPLDCLDLERLASIYNTDSIAGRCLETVERVQGHDVVFKPGEPVSTLPTVRLLDPNGEPVGGITVAFAQEPNNSTAVGTVRGGVVVSDAQGLATPEGWDIADEEGEIMLLAWIGERPGATFEVSVREAVFHALTVTQSGQGGVTSSPQGIQTSQDSSSSTADFEDGTAVTLTATPAEGWQVESWGGACSGSGGTCEVSMMGDRSVAVLFEKGTPPSITTGSLPDGKVDESYSATLRASGGTTPYTWSIASGSLPAGLSLATGGSISGTPTDAGTSSFTVRVTGGDGLSDTRALSITVSDAEESGIVGSWQAKTAEGQALPFLDETLNGCEIWITEWAFDFRASGELWAKEGSSLICPDRTDIRIWVLDGLWEMSSPEHLRLAYLRYREYLNGELISEETTRYDPDTWAFRMVGPELQMWYSWPLEEPTFRMQRGAIEFPSLAATTVSALDTASHLSSSLQRGVGARVLRRPSFSPWSRRLESGK